MTFDLVVRSIGRVLWFAIAGALCMALVGVVAGAITGGLLSFLIEMLTPSNAFVDMLEGAFFVSVAALCVSVVAGFFAFAIAGFLACFSELPTQVFWKNFRLSWRATSIGVIIGSILGPINLLLFGRFFVPSYALMDELITGYVIGVIAGFIIGIFYGALVGAKREIARQKAETKAALSNIVSAAS